MLEDLKAPFSTPQNMRAESQQKSLANKRGQVVNEKKDKRLCLNYGKHWPHQEGAGNCRTFGKRCTRCEKEITSNNFAKANMKSKPRKN